MKVLYLICVLLITMPFAVNPATADSSNYLITGTVYECNLSPSSYANLNLTNLETNETITTSANTAGEYAFHLENLELGWAYGDEIGIIGRSNDGLRIGYELHTYIYTGTGGQVTGVNPILPAPVDQYENINSTCEMDTYHRNESMNKWKWAIDSNKNYNVPNHPLTEKLEATGFAHDFGDDIPNIIGKRIHVEISFWLQVGKTNPGQWDTYVQDIRYESYNLTNNETYHWDPYLVVPLPPLWNGLSLTIWCGIRIIWTDWNGSTHTGAWIGDQKTNVIFNW